MREDKFRSGSWTAGSAATGPAAKDTEKRRENEWMRKREGRRGCDDRNAGDELEQRGEGGEDGV